MLASAGLSLAENASNKVENSYWNYQNRAWALEDYDRMKQDNLNFWAMQNEYNSPKAQLQRFQEAGLNPLLIYGQGSSGLAGNLSAPSSSSPNAKATNFDFKNGMLDYIAFKNQSAQTDNIIKQSKFIESQTRLNDAKTNTELMKEIGMVLDNARKQFENDKNFVLYETTVNTAKAQLEQINNNIRIANEQLKLNARQTATGEKNANTNEKNANTNAKNANTNAKNSDTSRMTALSNIERNNFLNDLTRNMTETESQKATNLYQQTLNAIETGSLTVAQKEKVFSEIRNLDARTFKTYLDAGLTPLKIIGILLGK